MMDNDTFFRMLEDPFSEMELGAIDSDENEGPYRDDSEAFYGDGIKSLAKSCIKCIVKNFIRFNSAFLNTNDRHLRKNLVFLQRAYTQQLMQRVHLNITDEYLSFFLNEHLKNFTLYSFDRSSLPAVIEKVKEIGHTFLTMDLFSTRDKQNDFPIEVICPILSYSPNVEQLDLNVYVDDDVLSALAASCRKIKVLKFDEDIKFFSPEDLLHLLKNVPTLQEIDLDELPKMIYLAHKQDYQNKALNTVNKYNLIKLNFTALIQEFESFFEPDNLTDILSVCCELCPKVKSVSIHAMHPEHLDPLTAFQELQKLKVHGYSEFHSSKLDVSKLLTLRADNLTEVFLHRCRVSIFSLLKCSKLKWLHLNRVIFDYVCEENSYLLNDLQKLSMVNVIFENSLDFACNVNMLQLVLSSSPNLHELSLNKCNIDKSVPQSIIRKSCTNTALKLISFKNSDGITADFVKLIVETCQHECLLIIDGCSPISDGEIDFIEEIDSKVRLRYYNRHSSSSSSDDYYFNRYLDRIY